MWLLSFLCLRLAKELPVLFKTCSPFFLPVGCWEATASFPWFSSIFLNCWCLGGAAPSVSALAG